MCERRKFEWPIDIKSSQENNKDNKKSALPFRQTFASLLWSFTTRRRSSFCQIGFLKGVQCMQSSFAFTDLSSSLSHLTLPDFGAINLN